MKRQTRGAAALDFSIRGDELEYNRIQLEHNLQNTELSFHLDTTSDEEDVERGKAKSRKQQQQQQPKRNLNRDRKQNNSSIEYPRHLSEPLNDFPSLSKRSVHDHFAYSGEEDHTNPNMHAWSYRTMDDEDGVSPYGGETVSTAAHHASALTITAGLGGYGAGRNGRREPSLSGAEYDPERPLEAMFRGVSGKEKLSIFEDTKNQGITYDPLVVDSTAELDRILESGHAHPVSRTHNTNNTMNTPTRSVHSVHPTPPTSSESASDSENGQPEQYTSPSSSTRPRLADHLRHVSFSPKRPRNLQQLSNANPGSPLARPARVVDERDMSVNAPTPRQARRASATTSSAYGQQQHLEVRVQPASPSVEGSRFTRMVRGINKELKGAKEQIDAQQAQAHVYQRPVFPPEERNPFQDSVNSQQQQQPPMRNQKRRTVTGASNAATVGGGGDLTNGKIHLPDVTGLTSAVESPAKPPTGGYYPYKGDGRPRDIEARLLQTMNAVQIQLKDLEEENGISRRRVRELEMELEECKREVARERTRLFEREEMTARNIGSHENVSYRSGRPDKGKGKAREAGPAQIDDERLHARYKEAVDEKKALEALINSLRSHLTRLTSELASHQALLAELRNLRDSDSQTLKSKSGEIDLLKDEVQRLAGEVEVLRNVVEEGLKERRASKENIQVEGSEADIAMSHDTDEEGEEAHVEEQDSGEDGTYEPEESEEDMEEDEEEDDDIEAFDSRSLQDESSPAAARSRATDRTIRTDYATLGESTKSVPRFVDVEELEDIAAEVEERRLNLSVEIPERQPSPTRMPTPRKNRQQQEESTYSIRSPTHIARSPRIRPQEPARPFAPTPKHATQHYRRTSYEKKHDVQEHVHEQPETPFPQIRGEHLERLFFSAPEHNPRTCTVCYRRRNRTENHAASWARPRSKQDRGQEDVLHQDEEDGDEGYFEGSEGAEAERVLGNGNKRDRVTFTRDAAHWRKVGREKNLPPQTVLARIIRELEDDFTHYKSIYIELADQYKVMDAVSDVLRRNLLARHLREVVDVLEQKGDQIASLYDLLEFKDKPTSESAVPDRARVVPSAR